MDGTELRQASRLGRLVAMADQPQERSREALQDESFEQVKALWTVDFHSHNQQAPYPSGPDLTNAMHLFRAPSVRVPQVKDYGIKPLSIKHRHQSLATRRKCMFAAKILQQTTQIADRRPVVEDQNFSVQRYGNHVDTFRLRNAFRH